MARPNQGTVFTAGTYWVVEDDLVRIVAIDEPSGEMYIEGINDDGERFRYYAFPRNAIAGWTPATEEDWLCAILGR